MSKSVYLGATLLFIITAFSSPQNTDIKANPHIDTTSLIKREVVSILDTPILTKETKLQLEESYNNMDIKIRKAEKESSKLKSSTAKTNKQAKVIENLITSDSLSSVDLIDSITIEVKKEIIKDSVKKESKFIKFFKNIKLWKKL